MKFIHPTCFLYYLGYVPDTVLGTWGTSEKKNQSPYPFATCTQVKMMRLTRSAQGNTCQDTLYTTGLMDLITLVLKPGQRLALAEDSSYSVTPQAFFMLGPLS